MEGSVSIGVMITNASVLRAILDKTAMWRYQIFVAQTHVKTRVHVSLQITVLRVNVFRIIQGISASMSRILACLILVCMGTACSLQTVTGATAIAAIPGRDARYR